MKSMNNNNWLGFSLSPYINMEVSADPQNYPNHQNHHYQAQASSAGVSSAVPSSYFLSPSHLNSSGFCYGVEGENGGFYSQLSVMPLKSDGSLCIMEALNRSQQEGMVPSPSPKLEDFLGGGPNMGTHQYENNARETMALSLDSMYYHHNQEPDGIKHQPLGHLHQPFRQQIQMQQQQHQHQYFQPLEEGICSGFADHEMFQAPLEEETIADDGIRSLKNWAARHYGSASNGLGDEGDMGSGPVRALGFGDLQPLSLSMSPGSQSSCVTVPQQIPPVATTECMALVATKRRGTGKGGQKQSVHRKSIDTFGQRTSQYRGVTRHRWTGRYEAHLWDNSCKKEGQTRKGRQVYLGGYDMEEKAARAYDLAALKYWGPSTHINFQLDDYHEELEEMKNLTRQEYVAHLRRKSSGFSRGASMYRGVTRHHQHGRWQARIGRVAGNKDLYLGTFSTQEEAAEAYDIAAIKFRGLNAVTNFDITRYDVERIMASNTLLSGELTRRNKTIEVTSETPSAQNSSRDLDLTEDDRTGGSDWKMAFELHDPKPMTGCGNYQNSSLFVTHHDLIGIETVNPAQGVNDDSGKMGTAPLSNSSSLVTSLSSSREGSPDRTGVSMLFAKPSPKFISPTSMSSWVPSTQLRPAISLAHLPLFAAWTDA